MRQASDNVHTPDLPDDPESSLRTESCGTDGPLIESGRGSSSWRLRLEDGEPDGRGSGEDASYILRRRVGRGGMGEVWEALQISLGRVVAVKRIREDKPPYAGGTPEECSLRAWEFRREGIIAARLEHPNIVPVHDLGQDESGRPLLAMKLVRGRPWHRVLREDFEDLPAHVYYAKHLPTLVSVVQAVAFAHAHDILHRDLKPSQVMVGDYGEVLLMDWGLAVYTGSDPLPKGHPDPVTAAPTTLKTASNPAGTPVMMAPEQTEKTTARLGPWTDVYLLGGILYFILTCRYPHAADDSAAAMRHAAAGFVRPPNEAAPGRDIPQDLAELAMAALRPEPRDRVASARAFLAALEDHLSGASRMREAEAILRRTRESLSTAGGSYDELSHCLEELRHAGELWPDGAPVRELRARVLSAFSRAALESGDLRLARLQADRLHGDARTAMLAEVDSADSRMQSRERQRRLLARAALVMAVLIIVGGGAFTASLWDAKRRIAHQRDLGEDLVAFMIEDVSSSLRGIGKIALLRDVADKTVEYYNAVDDGAPTAEAVIRRARALTQIGDVYAQQNLSRLARETFEHALEAIQPAAEGPFATDEGRNFAAVIQGRLMTIDIGDGRHEDALRRALESVEARRRLVQANEGTKPNPYLPELGGAVGRLGVLHLEAGRPAEARAALEECRKVTEQVLAQYPRNQSRQVRRTYSANLNHLAEVCRQLGDEKAADEARRTSVAIMRDLVAEEPDNTEYAEYYATALGNLAIALGSFEETSETLQLRSNAADIMRSLVNRDPLNVEWKRMLSVHIVNIAQTRADMGEPQAGLSLLDEADAIDRQLLASAPERADIVVATHHTLLARGAILNMLHRPEESLQVYAMAIQRLERAETMSPRNPAYRRLHATAYNETAFPWFDLKRTDKAIEALEKSHALLLEAVSWSPDDLALRASVYPLASNLGVLWERSGDAAKSRQWRAEGLRLSEELVAAAPDNPAFLNYHVLALDSWTKSLEASGEYAEALSVSEKLGLAAERMLTMGGAAGIAVRQANSHLLRARYLRLLDRFDESAAAAEKAREVSIDLAQRFPREALLADIERSSYFAQGRALDMGGRHDEARPLLQRSIELIEAQPDPDARERMNLAEALLRLGRIGEARPILEGLASESLLDPTLAELASKAGIEISPHSGGQGP